MHEDIIAGTAKDAAHFLLRTKKRGKCLEWNGFRHPKPYNYGKTSRNVAGHVYTALAHRVAFAIANGPIPHGKCVLHRCDNPSCVRVSHLFLGTAKDNMRDMREKGRGPDLRGENGPAKLTYAQVRAIRARRGCTQQELADEFGVERSNVSCILLHKTWTNI